MELFELTLLLLGAVLVATVLDQVTPRVSLPLVQIGLGAAIALMVGAPLEVDIDPELFLVLFIAPLLFDESRHASKRALWDNKGSIVSLAIGLVLITVLIVGFILHLIEPSIPLAAAFALGAALGPTDAVAVAALSKDICLSNRQKALLSGEALINDASGVVSFQFAIAAAITGAFSLVDAAVTFAASFCGGIVLGLALGMIATITLRALRNRGLESATVHVLFEVFTPFIVFLIAESVHVSGILAVVAAGLLMTLLPQRTTPVAARLQIASTNVWDALVFVINGVVFVLLGMQLPKALIPTWNSTQTDSLMLAALVVLLTVLVEGVRFLWVLGMEAFSRRREERGAVSRLSASDVRDALVTTLSGPKGAVTLSIALTIPFSVAYRSTLIFLASGVILCTLLLANFVVPLLASKPDNADHTDENNAATIKILQHVIRTLREQQTAETKQATQIVIRQYRERIRRLRRQNTSAVRLIELRVGVLDRQREHVRTCMAHGSVGRTEGQDYLEQIAHMKKLLLRRHTDHETFGEAWGNFKIIAMRMFRSVTREFRNLGGDETKREASRQFRKDLEQCALDYLEPLVASDDVETAEGAAVLAAECRASLATLEAQLAAADSDAGAGAATIVLAGLTQQPESLEVANSNQIKARIVDVEAEALRLELDEIQRMREADELDRSTANALREEVYLLQIATGN